MTDAEDDAGVIVRPYVMTPEECEELFGPPTPPLPGRLGDRCPRHKELSDRLKEVNDRSRKGGLR